MNDFLIYLTGLDTIIIAFLIYHFVLLKAKNKRQENFIKQQIELIERQRNHIAILQRQHPELHGAIQDNSMKPPLPGYGAPASIGASGPIGAEFPY